MHETQCPDTHCIAFVLHGTSCITIISLDPRQSWASRICIPQATDSYFKLFRCLLQACVLAPLRSCELFSFGPALEVAAQQQVN